MADFAQRSQRSPVAVAVAVAVANSVITWPPATGQSASDPVVTARSCPAAQLPTTTELAQLSPDAKMSAMPRCPPTTHNPAPPPAFRSAPMPTCLPAYVHRPALPGLSARHAQRHLTSVRSPHLSRTDPCRRWLGGSVPQLAADGERARGRAGGRACGAQSRQRASAANMSDVLADEAWASGRASGTRVSGGSGEAKTRSGPADGRHGRLHASSFRRSSWRSSWQLNRVDATLDATSRPSSYHIPLGVAADWAVRPSS